MKRIAVIITTSLIYSTQCFAMFCPNNFNQVDLGSSIDQVIQQCGKPDSIKTSKNTDNEPQEWNYYVHIQPTQQPQTGSLRMTIAFENAKVINISVNGAGITNTAVCGKPITLGLTPKQIEAICGKPVFINKGASQKGTTSENMKSDEITEFDYNQTPPIKLIFTNGKLSERK